MQFSQKVKILGDKCPECGASYVQGLKGVYCKPCYVKWVESKKQGSQQTHAPINSANDSKPDWDKIAEGKVRNGFAIEAYKKGLRTDDVGAISNINNWTRFVMTGQVDDQVLF